MPVRDEPWPAGTPSWCDLTSSDTTLARRFYGELFGWQIDDAPPEYGGYLMALLEGRPVAGIGVKPADAEYPPVRTTYLATDDATATLARSQAAGGTPMFGPLVVPEMGRVAVAFDPVGAPFGLWEPGGLVGFAIYNQTGAVCWNELLTRDIETAKPFYADVFGYTFTQLGDGESFVYWLLELGDHGVVGGLGELSAEVPDDVPDHWMTYFASVDVDASASRAAGLGGTVLREPWDSGEGRIAVIAGPEGEWFGVIDPSKATNRG